MRKRLLARRSRLSRAEKDEFSKRAGNAFLDGLDIPPRSIVALYWPMGDELDCRGLMKDLQEKGIQICLPCIIGPDQPLIFREYCGEEKLVPAGFGTHEPVKDAPVLVPIIVVAPLLGFDGRGQRIGYGKGFYDRTISQMRVRPELVGLAFSCQEVDRVPSEAHDVRLDMIVSEKGLRRF